MAARNSWPHMRIAWKTVWPPLSVLPPIPRMANSPCPCVQRPVEVEEGRGRAKRNGAEKVRPGTGVREFVPNRPRQKRRP